MIAVVGNKVDLASERQVSREKLDELGEELEVDVWAEVSAKESIGIDDVMCTSVRVSIQRYPWQ